MIATRQEVRAALIEQNWKRYAVSLKREQLGIIGKMCRSEIKFCRAIAARTGNNAEAERCKDRISQMQRILQALANNKLIRKE
jgi:hypothetical protein